MKELIYSKQFPDLDELDVSGGELLDAFGEIAEKTKGEFMTVHLPERAAAASLGRSIAVKLNRAELLLSLADVLKENILDIIRHGAVLRRSKLAYLVEDFILHA